MQARSKGQVREEERERARVSERAAEGEPGCGWHLTGES